MEAIEVTKPAAEPGTEEEQLVCDCDHSFTRGGLDVRQMVYIEEYDGTLAGFDIDDYTTTRNECPVCSDCTIEDDKIRPAEVDPVWMCAGCLSTYDDQDDAEECCS